MNDSFPQCCGIIGSDLYRSTYALFLFRRCVDICDEFLEMCRSEFSSDSDKIASMLLNSIDKWGPQTIKQRAERFNVFCDESQLDNAFRRSCAKIVRLNHGTNVKGEQVRLKIRVPKLEEFVQKLFLRLARTRELRNGTYFAKDTTFRNYAVSGAMMDALEDVMQSNFKAGEVCDATPGPMTMQQPMHTVQSGYAVDRVTRTDTAHPTFNQIYPNRVSEVANESVKEPNLDKSEDEDENKSTQSDKSKDDGQNDTETVLKHLQQKNRPPSEQAIHD